MTTPGTNSTATTTPMTTGATTTGEVVAPIRSSPGNTGGLARTGVDLGWLPALGVLLRRACCVSGRAPAAVTPAVAGCDGSFPSAETDASRSACLPEAGRAMGWHADLDRPANFGRLTNVPRTRSGVVESNAVGQGEVRLPRLRATQSL